MTCLSSQCNCDSEPTVSNPQLARPLQTLMHSITKLSPQMQQGCTKKDVEFGREHAKGNAQKLWRPGSAFCKLYLTTCCCAGAAAALSV